MTGSIIIRIFARRGKLEGYMHRLCNKDDYFRRSEIYMMRNKISYFVQVLYEKPYMLILNLNSVF